MTGMRARLQRAMASNPRLSPVTVLPLVTFVASAWLAAIVFYRDLPELLPTHWSTSWRADDFTAKPWGPFVFPAMMTVVWLARRLLRHLSFPRARAERFPGAFDFRIMLTIGLLFVIWNLVIVQSVFWLRALAVPVSVALVVAGGLVATVNRTWFVIAGLAIFAIVALGT